MRFNELARDSSEDRSGTWEIDDTRRPRLTLRHLNKMRNMQELAKVEHQQATDNYKIQYGPSASE
jgi:hypothetical protein